MEVGLSDSGMAGGKVVDLVGLCLKLILGIVFFKVFISYFGNSHSLR